MILFKLIIVSIVLALLFLKLTASMCELKLRSFIRMSLFSEYKLYRYFYAIMYTILVITMFVISLATYNTYIHS